MPLTTTYHPRPDSDAGRVLALVLASDGPLTSREVSDQLGINYKSATVYLSRLAKYGFISSITRCYARPKKSENNPG